MNDHTLKVLMEMKGPVTMLTTESGCTLDEPPSHVRVQVDAFVRVALAAISISYVFPITMEPHIRSSNARMMTLAQLDEFVTGHSAKPEVAAPAPAAAQPPPETPPAPAAPRGRKPKAAAAAEESATPPPPPPPPAPEPATPPPPAEESEPEPDSDEPGSETGEPEWEHPTPAEEVLVVYGAAKGQKIGTQSVEKLRWMSGTVPGRIRDREQRELTKEEALMVAAASYLMDLREWREKQRHSVA